MCASQRIKPVGGIASVAVVPAGTAAGGSPDDIAAAAVEVPVIEGRSSYDESAESRNGALRIEHRLTIAVPADYARNHFDDETCRRWATSGTAAIVTAESGERLAVGWSERMGAEQPLRLISVEAATDRTPHAIPAAVMTFRSVDTAPAVRIND